MKAKMKTLDELKPVHCGCGGEAKVVKALCNDKKGNPFVMGYSVNCEICGTRTRPMSAGAMAVAVWNRAMGADVNSVVSVFSSEVKDE